MLQFGLNYDSTYAWKWKWCVAAPRACIGVRCNFGHAILDMQVLIRTVRQVKHVLQIMTTTIMHGNGYACGLGTDFDKLGTATLHETGTEGDQR